MPTSGRRRRRRRAGARAGAPAGRRRRAAAGERPRRQPGLQPAPRLRRQTAGARCGHRTKASRSSMRSGGRAWAIQVAPDAAELAALAAARGLVPHPRAWVKFARAAEPPPTPLRPSRCARRRPAMPRPSAASSAAAFGLPDAIAPWAAALVGRPRWRCFLGWDGAEPVAVGALYLGDGLGWIGFGGTLAEPPRPRRRSRRSSPPGSPPGSPRAAAASSPRPGCRSQGEAGALLPQHPARRLPRDLRPAEPAPSATPLARPLSV